MRGLGSQRQRAVALRLDWQCAKGLSHLVGIIGVSFCRGGWLNNLCLLASICQQVNMEESSVIGETCA